ncbi:flagellar protein FlaG [mine drainage metagenome]|uniref:Flagellar protein FlaG n=1 Tax=mine drainage metagenome TaxID=410659 RepID=A0A1J5Q308_9ZZZZ
MNSSSSVNAFVSQPYADKLAPFRAAQTPGSGYGADVAAARAAQTGPSGAAIPVPAAPPAADDLKKLVNAMQSKVNLHSSDLQFSIDQESGKTIIKVTDRTTNDVIWQFPSEEALQVTKELDRYQHGLLVNRKA